MKKSKIFVLITAAALITMACACPVSGWLEKITNPDPQALLEEMLPEDLGGVIDEMVTAIPDIVDEGIAAIPESLNEEDLQNLFDQGVPENIPMVEDYADLLAFGGVINYSTTTSMDAMKEFYQAQMPLNGWSVDESIATTDLGPYATALNYVNDSETATITIVESEGQTLVTIIVTGK